MYGMMRKERMDEGQDEQLASIKWTGLGTFSSGSILEISLLSFIWDTGVCFCAIRASQLAAS